MQFTDPRRGLVEIGNALKQYWRAWRAMPPDRREYTLMFVPHHGKNVFRLRIPIRLLKISAAVLCTILVITLGTFMNYRHAVNVASLDKVELEKLRQVNATQNNQIEQLAKATAGLQEDMNRLNKLDSELRRLVNNEDLTATSRSGVARPTSAFNGQGGPDVKPQVAELINLVQEMQTNAQTREQSLTAMKDVLTERNSRLSATPSIWPAGGEVTSRFGWRSAAWGWGSEWHPGLDIANDYGTPIVATADGEVVFSGWYGGYGKMIQISHGYGVVTVYGHNSQLLVNVGDKVKKGETISYMGSTGYSTGNHVHYEIRVNGTAVNPVNFL
ncbi:MAG: M23 family metallopeptidase [Negativicutes bacterium]|nr:M23 family metallopeptidase [Negativicutes bacterium]